MANSNAKNFLLRQGHRDQENEALALGVPLKYADSSWLIPSLWDLWVDIWLLPWPGFMCITGNGGISEAQNRPSEERGTGLALPLTSVWSWVSLNLNFLSCKMRITKIG